MTFLPIVGRELAVSARQPLTYRLRFFTAAGFCSLWLLALWGTRHEPSASAARDHFEMFSGIALGLCLVAGVFLTADCLSAEKREGTLGLLFLTDLRGYDVVLGKLATTSLQSAYALLAMLPVMALPLLMGGVTPGEFWRMVLVLLAALFFSLALGMAMSAVSRDARQAMSLTAALVLFFSALLPAVGHVLTWANLRSIGVIFFWTSAIFADQMSTDRAYASGYHNFWGSLGALVGLGLAALLFGSLVLPQTWQERVAAREGTIWRRLRFGSVAARRRQRAGLLTRDPFEWLARRDHLIGWAAAGLFAVGLSLWVACFVAGWRNTSLFSMDGGDLLIFTTFGLQLLTKGLMAMESSRRLSEDRESGALELLLATPLRSDQILRGQTRALWSQFRLPLFALLLLYGAIIWLPFGPITGNDEIRIIFGGNAFILVADFIALSRLAMWHAMVYRHPRAVLATMAWVFLPSWGAFLVMGFSGFFHSLTGLELGFCVWVFFSCLWSIGLALHACGRLQQDFNDLAAGIKRPVHGAP